MCLDVVQKNVTFLPFVGESASVTVGWSKFVSTKVKSVNRKSIVLMEWMFKIRFRASYSSTGECKAIDKSMLKESMFDFLYGTGTFRNELHWV